MSAEIVRLPAPARETPKWWSKEGLDPVKDHHLRIYVPTGEIYVRMFFKALNIPELRKPTGYTTANKLKARQSRDELIEKHKAEHLAGTAAAPGKKKLRLIGSIIDEILEVEKPKKRPRTQENYDLYLGKIIRKEWGAKTLATIDHASVKNWIDKERRKGKRRTFMDYAKYMNKLCSYAHQAKYTPYLLYFPDPDAEYRKELLNKKIRGQKQGVDLLTDDEKEVLELKEARVLTSAETDKLWAVMDEATKDQFACALGCIMRKREALEAPWSEIDLRARTWTLPPERVKTGSKTGVGRTFRIPEWVAKRLERRFIENAGRSKFVFPGWSRDKKRVGVDKPVNDNKRAWATAKRRAGIKEPFKFHWIRHTALTWAILGDASLPEAERNAMKRDIEEVSKYAGVSVTTLRRVYLHADAAHTESVSTAISFSASFPPSLENLVNLDQRSAIKRKRKK